MRFFSRQLWGIGAALVLAPGAAAAQQGVTLNGRVTSDAGVPLANASVFIDALGAGTLTRDDGRYSFAVPAARAQGQAVTLTARLIGYKAASTPVTLTPGSTVSHDFVLAANPLRLGEVVVTGSGT